MSKKRRPQVGQRRNKLRQPYAFDDLVSTCNSVEGSELDVIKVSSALWESINSPVSLGLWLRVKYSLMESALTKTIDPLDYNDADSFLKDLQATKFLSKSELSVAGIDKELNATLNHDEAESECAKFNLLLRVANAERDTLLSKVTQSISSILGPFPGAADWADACRFSAGATQGGRAYLSDKLHTPTVTDSFFTLGSALVAMSPMWHSNCTLSVARGETFSLVPKSWKTYRDIGVQPTLNIYAQLGLGRLLRTRLRRAGCDLDRGWLKNQSLAKSGSRDGSWATIDLKNASNSLSKELVRRVLPVDWFHALTSCRCSHQIRNSETRELHRFSAMGNGYTFELESLIFLCIARVCLNNLGIPRREATVFGDDIIVPTGCYKSVVHALGLCGFTVNEKKSFASSYFRESCGAQFFNGRDVRPVQAKYSKENHYVPHLVTLANGLRRASLRFGLNGRSDNFIRAAWVRVIKRIPKCIREAISTSVDNGSDERLLCDTGCAWYSHATWHRWNRQLQRVETPTLSLAQNSRAIHRWDTRLLVNLYLMGERDKAIDSTVLSEVTPISSSKELKKNGVTAIRFKFAISEPGSEVFPL